MDIAKVEWDKYEEGGTVVNFIERRWRRGLLTIVKFLGLSGMGKSYASIRCAELLAKRINGNNYKIERRNIIKNLLQLIRFIKSVKETGEIMIIEEMSVLFPSRRAMSGINVDANAIVDTVRKKGIIMLANYPLNKTVDSHIEAMCCLQLITTQLNKKVGVCIARPLKLQTNPAIPKTYYHKLIDKNGDDIDFVFFRSPSKELINPYEDEKDELMNELYETLEAKEKLRQEKLDKELQRLRGTGSLSALSKRQLEIYNYVYVKKFSVVETAKVLGVTDRYIYQTIRDIKNKIVLPERDESKRKNSIN